MRNQVENRHEQAKVIPFLQDHQYFYRKGLKAYRERNLQLAVKMLQRAFELNRKDEEVIVQLAMVYMELMEYEKSNELFQYILEEVNPDFVAGYYFMANNFAHLGLFQEAYKCALTYEELDLDGEFRFENEELIEMLAIEGEEEFHPNQDDLIVKQEVAKSYLEKGQFQEAIDELKELINQYPEFWSAYNHLALAHFYLGDAEEAYRYLSFVLEKNPGNLHALCNLLVFYFYEGKEQEMERLVEDLSKIRPILVEQRYKLGATFSLVGYYEEAFQFLYQLYRKGFQGDETFYYWLSYSAYYTGHHDLAEKCWRNVMQLNPEKVGVEPWSEEMTSCNLEEELYEIYCLKDEPNRKSFALNRPFRTAIEKEAIEYVLADGKEESSTISFAFQVADLLKIRRNEEWVKGWFRLFISAMNQKVKLQNVTAWAAAFHYLYEYGQNEKSVTKASIAKLYTISISTLSKYVKVMEQLMK